MQDISEPNRAAFYLYSTLGCHLCDDAKLMLEPMMSHFQFTFEVIDIADPPIEWVLAGQIVSFKAVDLVDTWGEKIPVLACSIDDAVLCWPFDEQAVIDYLKFVFGQQD